MIVPAASHRPPIRRLRSRCRRAENPNFNPVMEPTARGDDGRHWMVANVNGAPGSGHERHSGELCRPALSPSRRDAAERRRPAEELLATISDVGSSATPTWCTLQTTGESIRPGHRAYSQYPKTPNLSWLALVPPRQFAVGLDKRQPYETDVKVPFCWGPVSHRAPCPKAPSSPSTSLRHFCRAGVLEDTIDALGFDGAPGGLPRAEASSS